MALTLLLDCPKSPKTNVQLCFPLQGPHTLGGVCTTALRPRQAAPVGDVSLASPLYCQFWLGYPKFIHQSNRWILTPAHQNPVGIPFVACEIAVQTSTQEKSCHRWTPPWCFPCFVIRVFCSFSCFTYITKKKKSQQKLYFHPFPVWFLRQVPMLNIKATNSFMFEPVLKMTFVSCLSPKAQHNTASKAFTGNYTGCCNDFGLQHAAQPLFKVHFLKNHSTWALLLTAETLKAHGSEPGTWCTPRLCSAQLKNSWKNNKIAKYQHRPLFQIFPTPTNCTEPTQGSHQGAYNQVWKVARVQQWKCQTFLFFTWNDIALMMWQI